MKVITLLALVCLIAGCGKGENSPQPESSPHPAANQSSLFRSWISVVPSNPTLDLSEAALGQYPIRFVTSDDSWIACTADIVGTESEGSAHIFDCTYHGPPPGYVVDYKPADYLYEINADKLSLCLKDAIPASCSYFE
jgi:hypothetical protein